MYVLIINYYVYVYIYIILFYYVLMHAAACISFYHSYTWLGKMMINMGWFTTTSINGNMIVSLGRNDGTHLIITWSICIWKSPWPPKMGTNVYLWSRLVNSVMSLSELYYIVAVEVPNASGYAPLTVSPVPIMLRISPTQNWDVAIKYQYAMKMLHMEFPRNFTSKFINMAIWMEHVTTNPWIFGDSTIFLWQTGDEVGQKPDFPHGFSRPWLRCWGMLTMTRQSHQRSKHVRDPRPDSCHCHWWWTLGAVNSVNQSEPSQELPWQDHHKPSILCSQKRIWGLRLTAWITTHYIIWYNVYIYIYMYRLVELTEIPRIPYELANIQVEHRKSQL